MNNRHVDLAAKIIIRCQRVLQSVTGNMTGGFNLRLNSEVMNNLIVSIGCYYSKQLLHTAADCMGVRAPKIGGKHFQNSVRFRTTFIDFDREYLRNV